MPECRNCGGHVTQRAVKVFYSDPDTIDGCVYCQVFKDGEFHEPRSVTREDLDDRASHEAGLGPSDNLAPAMKPRGD